MTARKYKKLIAKLSGAKKLLQKDEAEFSVIVENMLTNLIEKYDESFPEAEVEEEDEKPKHIKLAFLSADDEMKYGFYNSETHEGGFDTLNIAKKSKHLIKLIEKYGADVIEVKIGQATRARDRLSKIAEKSGYKVESRGTEYVMVKDGYSVSKAEVPVEIKDLQEAEELPF